MAKHGRNASVLFDQYDLSIYFKSADTKASAELLDATHFQSTDKEFVAGFRDGRISVEGFFSADSVNQDDVDDVLGAALGSEAQHIVTVASEGITTLGNRANLALVDEVTYQVSSPAQNLIMSSAEFQSSSGIDYGVVLQPLATVTATGNGTSVDNGADSDNGAVANLHVTAGSGTTPNMVVKIQHSDDGSTWVDLITFTAATGATSERKTVSGTIGQYTRVIRTITGTGPSFTFAVAFARL